MSCCIRLIGRIPNHCSRTLTIQLALGKRRRNLVLSPPFQIRCTRVHLALISNFCRQTQQMPSNCTPLGPFAHIYEYGHKNIHPRHTLRTDLPCVSASCDCRFRNLSCTGCLLSFVLVWVRASLRFNTVDDDLVLLAIHLVRKPS